LLGFTPGESNAPAMKHPATQLAPLHTSPVAQTVPLATVVHWLVLVPGWHVWQALAGFVVPDA